MATECPTSCRRDYHKHKLPIRDNKPVLIEQHLITRFTSWINCLCGSAQLHKVKEKIGTLRCDLIASVFINNREPYWCCAKDDFCRMCHPCRGCAKVTLVNMHLLSYSRLSSLSFFLWVSIMSFAQRAKIVLEVVLCFQTEEETRKARPRVFLNV